MRRCLEKGPEDRFHSAHDLALALEAVLDRPAAVGARRRRRRDDEPVPRARLASRRADADRFFGREAEVAALWERLRPRQLLARDRALGGGQDVRSCGRGSCRRARPAGRCVMATPGRRRLPRSAQALVPELRGRHRGAAGARAVRRPRRALRLVGRWRKAGTRRRSLVVDQFEELFTLNPAGGAGALRGAARPAGRRGRRARAPLAAGRLPDALPRPRGARPGLHGADAARPARRGGAAPRARGAGEGGGLPLRGRGSGRRDVGAVEGERGALPLLAFAVSRLWERRDRERKLLTRAALRGDRRRRGRARAARGGDARADRGRAAGDRAGDLPQPRHRAGHAGGVRARGAAVGLPGPQGGRGGAGAARRRTAADVLRDAERRADEREAEAGRTGSRSCTSRCSRPGRASCAGRRRTRRARCCATSSSRPRTSGTRRGGPADLLWTGTSFREYELWRERYPGKLTALEEDFAQAMTDARGAGGACAARRSRRRSSALSRRRDRRSASRASRPRRRATRRRRRRCGPSQPARGARAAAARRRPDGGPGLRDAASRCADTPEARAFAMKALWEAAAESSRSRVGSAPPAAPRLQPRRPAGSPAVTPRRLASGADDGTRRCPARGPRDQPARPNVARSGRLDDRSSPGVRASRRGTARLVVPEGQAAADDRPRCPELLAGGRGAALVPDPERPAGRSRRVAAAGPGGCRMVSRAGSAASTRSALALPSRAPSCRRARAWLFARGRRALRASARRRVTARRAPTRRPPRRGHRAARSRVAPGSALSPTRRGESASGTVRDRRRLRRCEGVYPEAGRRAPGSAPRRAVLGDGSRRGDGAACALWDLAALPGARPARAPPQRVLVLARASTPPDGRLARGARDRTRAVLTFWPLRKRRARRSSTGTGLEPAGRVQPGRAVAGDELGRRVKHPPVAAARHRRPREPRMLELPEPSLWTSLAFDPRGRYLFVRRQQRPRMASSRSTARGRGGCPSRPRTRCSTPPRSRRAAGGSRRLSGYGQGEKTLRVYDVETGDDAGLPAAAAPASGGRPVPRRPGLRGACLSRLRRRDDALHRRRAAGFAGGTSRPGTSALVRGRSHGRASARWPSPA